MLECPASRAISPTGTPEFDMRDAKECRSTAQNEDTHAQQTANAAAAYKSRQASVQAIYQGKESALSAQQTTKNQQETTLKQDLGQVQSSSISSDGVYVVGQHIKPGAWHTNGDGGQSDDGCYYATLNDNTGSINSIANNNFDGPETVSVSG